jgi:hypothetical protein
MTKFKRIREFELNELASVYPDTVGHYDAAKKELKTPDGQILHLELARVGRSKPDFVAGKVKAFLEHLDLDELAKPESEVVEAISLSDVPERQVGSARSWAAWFKGHAMADPEAIRKAVTAGWSRAEAQIEKAREAEAAAQLRLRQLARAQKVIGSMFNTQDPAEKTRLINEFFAQLTNLG